MKLMTEIKDRWLATSVTGWRNAVSIVALFSMCSGGVATFGYILITIPELQCHVAFFYLSILWLVSECTVLAYLYCYRNIPKFAREAVVFSLLMANIWFILFIFGLQECSSYRGL